MQFVHNQYGLGYGGNAPSMSQQNHAAVLQNAQGPAYGLPQGYPAQSAASTTTSSGNVQPTANEYNVLSKPKRKQVKNACVNCQKACKKCDDGRPCQRCIKYGLTETCVNSVRKERKKGIKRGPYKRRTNGSATDSASPSSSSATAHLPADLYGTHGTAGIRAGNAPMPYPPFSNGAYDPYHGISSYANAPHHMLQMIQQQQQQQQQQQHLYHSMPYQQHISLSQPQAPSNVKTEPTLPHSQPQQQQPQQPQRQHSIDDTPSSGGQSPLSKNEKTEEGSKLNMLSRLCSDVLDRNDPPKEENAQNASPAAKVASRNASPYGADTPGRQPFRGPFGSDSPHTYVNGHLASRGNVYASPAASPPNSQAQSPVWPLPPLQSVLPGDRASMFQPQEPQSQQQSSFHPNPAMPGQPQPQNSANNSPGWHNNSMPQW